MNELDQLRQDRTEAWATFVVERSKADKATLKAQVARTRYMLLNEEVRAQERDLLAFPIHSIV
jgi:hypothetical protein